MKMKQCMYRGGDGTVGALRWDACPRVEDMVREAEYAAKTRVRGLGELHESVCRSVGVRMHQMDAHDGDLDCYLCLSADWVQIIEYVYGRALAQYANKLRWQVRDGKQQRKVI